MVVGWLSVELLLAGVAGGMLGVLLGGLPAFGLAGLVVVVGEMSPIVSGERALDPALGGVDPAPLDAPGLTGALGLGPLLGPHVAFAGGVAGAAYLGRRETVDTGFRYHQAKKITKPLGSAPDVLLVGAVFGAVGVLVARATAEVGAPLDPIALAVVVSALLHRLVLGYPLVGRLRGLDRPVLDMSPHEAGVRWGESPYDTAQGVEGRPVVEVWLPEHYRWQNVLGLGVAVGLASGYVALVSGSPFLAFGLAATALLLLALGLYSLPVVYHMALPAGIVAVALDSEFAADVPVVSEAVLALLLAGLVGALAGVVGELAQRLLYAHGDTHVDPPMVAILLTSLLVVGLAVAGVLDPELVPYPVP